MDKYAVKQLTVFLENKKGELTDVTTILSDEGITLRSLLLLDSTDFGILRLILDNPEKAKNILTSAGYTVKENHVFAVRMVDEIGSFNKVANIMSQQDINILYTYAFRNDGSGVFVFKVQRSDFSGAVEALKKGEVEILETSFFY